MRLHQAGQLQQAAALYRAVLTRDPDNADANHLLGMVALQQGEPKIAADFIGKAIAVNDREASYHFHFALALQSLNDMPGAVAGYRRALALKPDDPDIHNNLGNAFGAQEKWEEAVTAFRHALVLRPDNALAHNNLGHVQRSMGRWDEAEASFRKAIELQPGFAGAFVNLGNLHRDRKEWDKAENCFRHAVGLAPRDPAGHCGLGLILWHAGRSDDALASYRTALEIDPAHPETLVNLGIARGETGALDEAEALYARALAARPRDTGILNHLASIRLARNDGAGAMAAIRQSLSVRETPEARKLFVAGVQGADLRNGDEELRRLLVRALTEPWDRPGALAAACARMICSHPVTGPMVMRAHGAWPSPLSLDQLLGEPGFPALADDDLLAALLISAPNTDIVLEQFLTMVRGAMIREFRSGNGCDEQMLAFAGTLAQQCFINDYVFAAEPEELAAAQAVAEMADHATALQLLLFAAYFPLHSLAHRERLLDRPWPAPVEAVLTQQVREPLREERLRTDIPRLTVVESPVSRRVKEQYEENPYPRWVRAAPEFPDRIDDFLRAKFPFASFERGPAPVSPAILIAGCGTGQRSIAMAQKFGAPNMLAIDLSLASLGYARRKSEELGLAIEYAQADILELDPGRQFDLIESLGVLHHMADPWAGWEKLLSLLRPGGCMLLGLYSAAARRPVREARGTIAGHGADAIRRVRQELIQAGASRAILDSEDFFSLSGCRDLLFHVQEQQLRLPQIARFLQNHDLRLLGFEANAAVLAAYRGRFPQDVAATDLACWEAFEGEHPGLFGGMYIFWIQKAGGAAGN